MSVVKASTLPTVLKEYAPEYEPAQSRQGSAVPPRDDGGQGKHKEGGGGRGGGPRPAPPPQQKRKRSGMGSRERSSDVLKRQEREKHEQMFDAWQNVKKDYREDETNKLKKKINLQLELIKKQDELYEVKEQEKQEQLAQKRQEEKQSRQAQTAELEKICRQSLEDDRQIRVASRQSSSQQDVQSHHQTAVPSYQRTSANTKRSYPNDDISTNHDSTPSGGDYVPDGDPGPLRLPTYMTEATMSSVGAPYIAGITPQGTMLGEDYDALMEEQDEDDEATRENTRYEALDTLEELPWHHAQLYDLYGDDADYFLHPKMQPEKKVITKPLNPKLKQRAGTMGAGELWGTLRNESRMKLIEEDSQIPNELKHTYSAFVRQCLARRKRPVKRNYYQHEDVPEMDRLMDQSKMQGAQSYRHKMEVMFRSSVMNEDKTNVLMFNNPPPDMNNWEGEESVQRYIPTWGENWDEQTQISYKKWLSSRGSQLLQEEDQSADSPKQQHQRSLNVSSSAAQDWTMKVPQQQPQQHAQQPQKEKGSLPPIVFLTEAAATVPGEFSRRRRAALDSLHLPQAYGGDEGGADGSQVSAMAMRGGQGFSGDSRGHSTLSMSLGSNLRSVGGGSRKGSQVSSSQGGPLWQPLSLSALQEYKDKILVPGQGGFSQGKTPIWSVQ